MARSQTRPKRKASGGRYGKLYRKKKQYELGSTPILTKVAPSKIRRVRVVGGNEKIKSLSADVVNLMTKEGKCVKTTIKASTENPANRNFVVRNILTKGAIIETEKGNARITNRPGQEGTINALFIE